MEQKNMGTGSHSSNPLIRIRDHFGNRVDISSQLEIKGQEPLKTYLKLRLKSIQDAAENAINSITSLYEFLVNERSLSVCLEHDHKGPAEY